jgi:hypothetical protein
MTLSENRFAEASLKLKYSDQETAGYILGAISPDNLQAPDGIKLNAQIDGASLLLEIYCRKGVKSLVATLDDLLSCVQAAEKAINTIG